MAMTTRIETKEDYSPVIIDVDLDREHPVMLRIGEPRRGETRIAELTPAQALAIGRSLIVAGRVPPGTSDR